MSCTRGSVVTSLTGNRLGGVVPVETSSWRAPLRSPLIPAGRSPIRCAPPGVNTILSVGCIDNLGGVIG